MKPLVSIVITNYNYGAFLAEAVESALGQSYANTEIIVIDDGSTDNSSGVLSQLAKKYPQMRIVRSRQNEGTVATKIKGIKASKGTFFLHLDADDALAPQAISQLVAALQAHPEAAYAYSQMELFGAKSGILPSRPFSAHYLAVKGNYISGSSLVRRSDYDATPGYQPIAAFEDWDLWLTFLEAGKQGVYVPQPLLRYRQHAAVTSRNNRPAHTHVELEKEIRRRHPRLYQKYAAALAYYRLTSHLKRKLRRA